MKAKLRSASKESLQQIESTTVDDDGKIRISNFPKPPRKLFKLPDGSRRRIRLASEATMIFFHRFNDFSEKQYPTICNKTFNEPCPICKALEPFSSYERTDPRNLIYFKMSSNPDRFFNMIDKKSLQNCIDQNEDYVVDCVQIPYNQWSHIAKISRDWGYPVYDPENGLDLLMDKSKKQGNIWIIQFDPADQKEDPKTGERMFPSFKPGKYAITDEELSLPGWVGLADPTAKDYDYDNEREIVDNFLYRADDATIRKLVEQIPSLFITRKSDSYEEEPKSAKQKFDEKPKASKYDEDEEDERPKKPVRKSEENFPWDDDAVPTRTSKPTKKLTSEDEDLI